MVEERVLRRQANVGLIGRSGELRGCLNIGVKSIIMMLLLIAKSQTTGQRSKIKSNISLLSENNINV